MSTKDENRGAFYKAQKDSDQLLSKTVNSFSPFASNSSGYLLLRTVPEVIFLPRDSDVLRN